MRRQRAALAESRFKPLMGRMIAAGLWVLATGLIGAAGYRYLSDGAWSWSDAAYMTVITVSTVGFGETLNDMGEVPYARLWTVLLILFGSAGLLTFISSFTAFIVENDLGAALARSRMLQRIDRLSNHCIVCGCGSTGEYVVRELQRRNTPFVIIEHNEEQVERLERELQTELLHIIGDATDDDILREAGVERARAVVAALHDDPDNLYVTLSTRTLNPDARIVARAIDFSAQRKMRLAGADSVVMANLIGGTRMAQEMVQPKVVQFLDQMLGERELELTELTLDRTHAFTGRSLQRADLRRRANALVLAVRAPDGTFTYNPSADFILEAGHTLIIVLPADKLAALNNL